MRINNIPGQLPGTTAIWYVLPFKQEVNVEGGTTTAYEIYADGKINVRYTLPNGGEKIVREQGDVEIFKTTSTTEGGTTLVERFHALGKWENRKELNYRPICEMLDEGPFGGSNRLLR